MFLDARGTSLALQRGHNRGFRRASTGGLDNPTEKGEKDMDRHETNMIWLKDMLEHLSDSREQLEWAHDSFAVSMITESMLRDLDCCRRLCESLRRRGQLVEAS
jgi:hypothetical protein